MRKKSPHLTQLAAQKFVPLKKNLQKTFRKISQEARLERLPDKGVMEQFLLEVAMMTSYPGFGDHLYDSFLAACRKLAALHKEQDLPAFLAQLERIKEMRQQCHEQFRL